MHRFPKRFWAGVAGLCGSAVLLAAGQEFVAGFFTPLAWTFYILAADGALIRLRGHSPLGRDPAHVGWTALASIAIWYVFEAYNLRLEGWRYLGLPENIGVRIFGYFWAFATIGPGLLLTRELAEALLFRSASERSAARGSARPLPRPLFRASIVLGAACLVLPLVVPQSLSRYLWAPVWAGFIFLVDPINAALGRASIWRDALDGRNRRLWTLLAAGLVCGILWELWNFWATTKWVYTFPFPLVRDLKLFEMPAAGFVGFPPFAVEYFVLTELLSRLWNGDADLGSRSREPHPVPRPTG